MWVDAGELTKGKDVSPPRAGSFTERFEVFFEQQYPRLVGFCTGLVGASDGPDVAQEALVRTFSRWSTVRDPHAYVYLVATNLVRSAWRQQQRHRQVLTLVVGGKDEVVGPDTGLRDLVERLPEVQRSPVLLHYYADLPIETVALLLSRPAGTVRRQLHEARTAMATDLRREEH